VGFAIIQIGTRATTDEVVFAEKSDFELLGVHAMEGLRLVLDPHGARLLHSGPALAAQNVAPKRTLRGRRRSAATRRLTPQELEDFRDAEVIQCTRMHDVRNLRKHPDGTIGLHTSGEVPTKAELDALEVVRLHRAAKQRPSSRRRTEES
jgi:hypothetical protein